MPEETRFYHDPAGRPVVETRFRVRYAETDAMGIVHHSSYIIWFEEGRSVFTRTIGYPYSVMVADGIDLAVVEVLARYHRPARYDDEVIVVTCLQELASRGMTFGYEVRRATDNALLVSGTTRHISVDAGGRVVRIPDAVRQRLLSAAGLASA
jgi:acyl-CoA thioester hydrolase